MQDDRQVVVIGSGPAGATAALFLMRRGCKVLLLEAGPEHGELALTVRVRGVTLANWRRRPLRNKVEGLARTGDTEAEYYEELAPGGLTNHWSCAVPRFSPDDFEDARRAGEEHVWPVGYSDLAPWYDEVEPLLHISGTTADVPQLPAGRVRHVWRLPEDWNGVGAAARDVGRSLLPLPYTYGSDTTITFSATVFNSYVRLLRPVRHNGLLSVKHDARATALEWSGEKKRVSAVIYRHAQTGVEHRVPCAAVVVAAGALNTARLLLESQSADFPEGLGNTDGVLGRYLHDHPIGKLVIDLDSPISIHPPVYISRPTLERTQPLYAASGVQWTGTAIRARSLASGRPGRLPWVGFNVFGTMAPSRENGITLDRSRSIGGGVPAMSLHIRNPPESLALLDDTRDQITGMLDRAGLKPRVRIWKVERPGSAVHFAGTCRMHASPRFGMLDKWSRLHAVQNVVVADSAAFTTGPEKNPVLTAMALAARASDRLAHDLASGAA